MESRVRILMFVGMGPWGRGSWMLLEEGREGNSQGAR